MCGCGSESASIDRGAMCYACVGEGERCRVTFHPVKLHVQGKPCPLLRHPVKGEILWRGLWWYGVPYPIRLWIWMRAGHSIGRYSGCGCVKVFKDIWTGICARLMQRRAGA